jgi:uncharacterized protein YcbK (DUF882 family)
MHAFDDVLTLPGPTPHGWRGAGIGRRTERALNVVGTLLLVVLALGWGWSIANARTLSEGGVMVTPATATIASALTKPDAPSAAYLSDAALTAYTNRLIENERGISGKLRATITTSPAPLPADTLPGGAVVRYERAGEVESAPKGTGIWRVVLAVGNAIKPVTDFNVIQMLPFTAKKSGRVGLYYVGNWPSERGSVGPKRAPSSAYANPAGFIEVTRENKDFHVSEHFRLGDFVTHDQATVWPKYLVLQPKLLDKLELVLADLQSRGVDVSGVTVMSGFRTPQYNAGGGNTGGRANLSRHMYGDASDIFIDSNHDGQMDDLNHDGHISIDDSRVVAAAVDRVEVAHPELVGGAGVYTAAPGHGPFIHIDTRGYRARWSGTSGG